MMHTAVIRRWLRLLRCRSCSTAACSEPGLPRISLSRATNWSLPIMVLSACSVATLWAFALARKIANSVGFDELLRNSVLSAASSHVGAIDVKSKPSLSSSLRLYFEVLARIICIMLMFCFGSDLQVVARVYVIYHLEKIDFPIHSSFQGHILFIKSLFDSRDMIHVYQ